MVSASAKVSPSVGVSAVSAASSASTIAITSPTTSSKPSAGVDVSPSSSITKCRNPGSSGSAGKSAGSSTMGWIKRLESGIDDLERAVLIGQVLLHPRYARLHVYRDAEKRQHEQRELDPVDAPSPHRLR